jgi:hypothetical protein
MTLAQYEKQGTRIESWSHVFSPFSLKKKREAYKLTMLSVCLPVCVCPPLITSETICRFHEIQQETHATEGDLDAIIFNRVALAIITR